MGHLGHLKEEYAALVKRLESSQMGLPEPREDKTRAAWREILEILYTPEDAALAAQMPVRPSGLGAIAARTGIAKPELEKRLDAMAQRGLVMDIIHPKTKKVRWFLSPPVIGFIEFSMMRRNDDIPKKRMAEALEELEYGDPTMMVEIFGRETKVGRALVQENVVTDDALPDVLDWERATEIVSEAKLLATATCHCRHKAEHLGKRCDAPVDACLSLDHGADFVLRRDFGRKIDKQQALDILEESRAHGLVQIADNVQKRPFYICNCCGCCCGQLGGIKAWNLPAVNPSGYLPYSNDQRCSGCSRCARACPIQAITMLPERVHAQKKNKMLPEIDHARCIGCGVCANACKKKSMKMTRKPERPYVPLNSVERITRMSLERGHLADLVFDAGTSRSFRYMNSLVRTLTRLPVAQQVMASEQAHSRFVAWALKNVKDPGGSSKP